MRAWHSGALIIAALCLAGCGGSSPSAPSPVTSTPVASSPAVNTAGLQSAVAAAMNQATLNAAITVSPDGLSRTFTSSCPGGGSTSVTFSGTTPVTGGTFTTSSRIDFTDCQSQTVTINGDPAIMMDGSDTFTTATGGAPSSLNSTTHMTGGVRFDAPGISGRAQYDCTLTFSMQIRSDGVVTPPTFSYTGTMTWEEPIGNVTVRSCGA